jgi:hypothetical protein
LLGLADQSEALAYQRFIEEERIGRFEAHR